MTHTAELILCTQQLHRLNFLLTTFGGYKNKIEDPFFYLTDPSVEANMLREFLDCKIKGLSMHDLFSMPSNMKMFEEIMIIYMAMKVSFHMKDFSFSNLFFDASMLMEHGKLSSDAVICIIGFIKPRREKALAVYHQVLEARAPSSNVPRAQEKESQQPTYRSYQQESARTSVNDRSRLFATGLPPVFLNETGISTGVKARLSGYGSINS